MNHTVLTPLRQLWAGGLCLLGLGLMQPALAQSAQDAKAPTVEVSSFEVTGNTLVSSEAIAKTLEPYKGQRSLPELNRAAQAVQQLYTAAGFGAVVAYVPVQTRTDGVISIVVLEGRLSSVRVLPGKSFDETNIKASLPGLVVGATPNLRAIDSQMLIANSNPSKELKVLLKPGAQPGQADAEVSIIEKPARRFTVALDDTGNDDTGNYRATLMWQDANLSGHDDVFTALYQTSTSQPDKVTVLSAGYRFPIYEKLMVIDAFAAYSDVDAGSHATAAGDLQFNGSGRLAGARATLFLPRLGDADQRASLGLEYREYLNNCTVEGLPSGACGSSGSSVSVQPLSLEYSLRSAGATPYSAAVSVHTNLNLGGRLNSSSDFDAVRSGADPHYTLFRLDTAGALALNESWQLRGRVNGQYSHEALVPGEQFGLGGAESVRGYDEREVLGDSGVFGSLELMGPELKGSLIPPGASLRLLTFADVGEVSNHEDTPCTTGNSSCTLASWGVGARFEWRDLRGQVVVAQALKNANQTQSSDVRAHFTIVYSF